MVSTSMLTTCMSFPMVVLMERTLRINLKCLCVSKVLENLSIFICYCYSHDTFSFFYCIFWVNLLFVTPSKAAVAALTVTDYEIPTLNFKRMSINENICYFLSGNLVNPLDRRSCDLHRFCTLLLTVTLSKRRIVSYSSTRRTMGVFFSVSSAGRNSKTFGKWQTFLHFTGLGIFLPGTGTGWTVKLQ